jgi:hypothetical protein
MKLLEPSGWITHGWERKTLDLQFDIQTLLLQPKYYKSPEIKVYQTRQ